MENIAPQIQRQRLLIEGFYSRIIEKQDIEGYFRTICQQLSLRAYGEPIVFSPGGEGKEENQGFDAFLPLIDSGISVYIWSNLKFFSIILFTCRNFDEFKALNETKKYFKSSKTVSMRF
ncbi:MAG: S-adenosylmethionine decarboxylase [Deltaproteobacteria bacterium]|nr:S-adenosylmethionine decarboxylase [Deltaproteobacteria bacterium]